MYQLLAHPLTLQSLNDIINAPRACYMLVGAPRSGRLASALYIATHLHCGAQEGCVGCKRILAGTDPDVIQVVPNEKGTITIEMAHELVDQLSKRAHRRGAQRVVIIQSAERMTSAAQNALLKLIEEPPADTIFLLIADNKESVLHTIASRCQLVYVRPVTDAQIAKYGSAEMAEIARGRAGLVMDMTEQPELKEVYGEAMDQAKQILAADPFERMLMVDSLANQKQLSEILDSLAYEVSRSTRAQNGTSQRLQSMQNYFIYSNAGVASKHALTEMMIRL